MRALLSDNVVRSTIGKAKGKIRYKCLTSNNVDRYTRFARVEWPGANTTDMGVQGPRSSGRFNGPSVDSQDLLRRARGGDADAADRLFARYLPQLRRWAHGRLPKWTRGALETADVVQETVLRTFRHLGSFEPRDGALLGYLRRALRNHILDQFRLGDRRPRTVPLDDEHPDGAESAFEVTAGRETRERYVAALARLRPADRNAIVGRLELGYSYEQLALILDKPTGQAARLALRRALLRLAREMEHGQAR